MTAELLTDEPLIRPVSAGSALMRLLQVQGAIRRQHAPVAVAESATERLQEAYTNLARALENGDSTATTSALQNAQNEIAAIYKALHDSGNRDAATWNAFGFPVPDEGLGAVDVASIVVTYAKPKKQVVTTIAFEDAAGAYGYWLHEITDLPGDEEVQDALISSKTPLFPRVRLPIGRHRLLIESRNLDEHVESQEFVIEVPDL